MDRYANLIAARLRRLALARSTGMLPFSDPCEGAIYFSDGGVAYAESARTPGAAVVPEVAGQPEPPPMPAKPRHATAAGPLSWGELLRILAITEATTDACLVLLTGEARYTRFRSTGDLRLLCSPQHPARRPARGGRPAPAPAAAVLRRPHC